MGPIRSYSLISTSFNTRGINFALQASQVPTDTDRVHSGAYYLVSISSYSSPGASAFQMPVLSY